MENNKHSGHKNRTLRAREMWLKWHKLWKQENWTMEQIAQAFKKKDGTEYNPYFVSRKVNQIEREEVNY